MFNKMIVKGLLKASDPGAIKTPIIMQKIEKRTGIKKAGVTLLIVLTPPNTIK